MPYTALNFDWSICTGKGWSTTPKYPMQTINTANSNLDGTGTVVNVITSPASGYNGTLVKSIIIKAQVTTTAGMIRLFFVSPSDVYYIIGEIPIPAVAKSGIAPSFFKKIDFEGQGLAVKSNWSLGASTEKGESFNIIVEGLDWKYPA